MTTDPQRQRDPAIAEYVAIARRYRWLIVVTALIVPIVAYAFSIQQPKVFRASADVLLSQQDLPLILSGIPTTTGNDPDRYSLTNAALARVPAVASRALKEARIADMQPFELLLSSSVAPRENTDLLVFSVDDRDSTRAAILATAYAAAFTKYKLAADTGALTRARKELTNRLTELRRSGGASSEAYRTLLQRFQDLRTLEILQTPATVVRPAEGADQVEPRPKRNAALGLMLGLMIGLGGAFVLNAFDRRIRDADDLERELQIPLLAKLPTPARKDAATIVDRTSDATTEAVARLRTSFDFANTDVGAKLVMVTSAGPREGKSTTLSNLGITLARTGRHVVLVDLDLRRPTLTRLLHLPDGPGITDLALGKSQLVEALQPVGIVPLRARLAQTGTSGTGHGRLEVVSVGRSHVEPSEFVESSGLTDALRRLRGYAEIVLVDSPPILATGDAMALTAKVDAVLLVSRLGTLTRPTLRELARVLSRSPAPILGFVATGAEHDEGYSAYTVDEYFAREQLPDDARSRPVDLSEAPRASAAGSGRWTPRRSR
jgi:tyrosine-protein kinase